MARQPGRWRRRLRTAVDVAVPLLVALFLLSVVLDSNIQPSAALRVVGLPLAVGQGVALVWRRSRPVLVTAVCLVGGLATQLLAPEGIIPVAGLVSVGALAAARPPVVSVPGLLALLGVTATNFWTASDEDTYFTMVLAVAAWALGEIARNRRAAIEQESRRAVVEERARIAREIHDVVAHSVSVIVVQATAADDVFDSRPDQARQALRSIETTGREALAELRRLLAPVRPGEATAGDGDDEAVDVGGGGAAGVPVRPPPGLDRVDELAAPLRAAGLHVTVDHLGQRRPLAPGVDVCAYRIVQEALTNTLRHAHATRVDVTITYRPATVELDVLDDGAGWAEAPGTGVAAGHGIVGMRERADMLGGTLDAGPHRPGGFRVHANLPT